MATYRIQLNKEFDFNKLKSILPYVAKLGISHIYASPIFKARNGSTHGYDVTDHGMINEELGGPEAFEDLTREVAACGLEWIQDIVPNHASYSPENRMILDIMEQGFNSKYYGFFDVDWDHPSSELSGRILAPFLENSYKQCLKRRQIRLARQGGFVIKYKDMDFPVKVSSYKEILQKTRSVVSSLKRNKRTLSRSVKNLRNLDKNSKEFIEEAIERYNGDIRLLDELLSTQVYALSYWRKAMKIINYRRFFDISDMICLRTEETTVFEAVHYLTLKLLAEGKISGLRVDHIDGLRNPEEYLERLRKRTPDAYVVVEKILVKGENLPSSWPIQGTTGYDFLNYVNEAFIDRNAEKSFDKIYNQFTRNAETYDELLYECKKLVIQKHFRGETDNLTRLLHQALKKKFYGKSCTARRLREAVVELLSCFPIYRTYLTEKNVKKEELETLRSALSFAKQRNKAAETELNVLEILFEESGRSQDTDALRFIMRLQQFTGAIMAKGFEDTTLYVYNRFLSLNEVGGTPEKFGGSTEDFHGFNSSRQRQWPFSMNATSTHDTKRGEDVRARLNVLSEIPDKFALQIRKWAGLNHRKKKKISGKLVPNRNEEYYLYQTLLGTFPFDATQVSEFTDRLKIHMVKAVREAKINSSWLNPDLQYEQALVAFVTELLDPCDDNDFTQEFVPFQKKIAFYGFINSLAQTLLKITSPGVPDFYQGAELWDLNLVDPDNRKPVDFAKRNYLLEQILTLEGKPAEIHKLLKGFEDGKVKLYEVHKSLAFRRGKRELFEEGEYVPLDVEGARKNHIIAFCRRKGTDFAITIVPRFLTSLTSTSSPIAKSEIWKDTHIYLPDGAPNKWTEIFTEESLFSKRFGDHEGLAIGEVLKSFPVALLTSGEIDY